METMAVQRCAWKATEEDVPDYAQELFSIARRSYRTFCLRAAHYASYFGYSLEPYSLQNQFLALIEPIPELPNGVESPVATLQLFDNVQHSCPVFRVTNENDEDIYIAYVGNLFNELANVRRFFSSRSFASSSKALVKAGETMQLNLPRENTHSELSYYDKLGDYVYVVRDRDTGKFQDIRVEYNEASSPEPTFEDVMTLWIAVAIWGAQVIGVGAAWRITGRICALVKNE